MIKVSKSLYLQVFGCIVIVLALLRCACPQIAGKVDNGDTADTTIAQQDNQVGEAKDRMEKALAHADTMGRPGPITKPHRIFSVPNFKEAFPDSQEVQMASAERLGVRPIATRGEAQHRHQDLVYIGASPYYSVDAKMKSSVPYLVPSAALLLDDIGRNFFDSLYVKGVPLHRFIVTSVLRTQEDVQNLQKRNRNATENSCHMYGTTFDIGYNRYVTVKDPHGAARRAVGNDTLKWVLSEVLRDIRESGRAHIKYEVKQGCFHITVR